MTSLFITYYFVTVLNFLGEMGLSCSFDRTEIEAYNILPPGVRVVILKALCDIRVEVQDLCFSNLLLFVLCGLMNLAFT